MAVLSAEAQEKIESSKYVGWSLTEHRGRIVESFVGEFGEKARPVISGMLELLAEKLGERREAVHTADLTVAGEVADDAALRAGRDAAVAHLYALTGVLDDAVTTTHGEAGAAHLGLSGTRPRDPEVLLRLGRYVLQQLPTLGPARNEVPGLTFDVTRFEPTYRASVDGLDNALDALQRDAKETDAVRADRDRTDAASDRLTSFAATFASATFSLLDEPVLARKVRLGRRPGLVIAVEEGDAPQAPAAPAEKPTG